MKNIVGLLCGLLFISTISCKSLSSITRGLIHDGPDFESSSSECDNMDEICDDMYEYRRKYKEAPKGTRKSMEETLRMYEERCNEAYKQCYKNRKLK